MSTATIPAPAIAPAPSNLTDKTVCVNVSFGFLGNSKKVPATDIQERDDEPEKGFECPVEVDADKTMVRVTKKLLESKELSAIHKVDSGLKGWLREHCLPSLFRGGIYLVPIALIQKVEAQLSAAAPKRAELVEAFLTVYEACRADAKERLKDLFDPKDYPAIEFVRAKFSFEWQYVTFSTPGKLKEISAEFFQQEQQKAEAHWKQATEEITLLLRGGMKDLVDHLLDRLTPGDNGKPKRLNKAAVENINEWLANFSLRNVTDDAALSKLVEEAKLLVAGADVKELRKNEAARDGLRKQFTAVKQQLDLLVEEAGSRKIVFED